MVSKPIKQHMKDKEWIRIQGGVIHYMLREQPCGGPIHRMGDCFKRIMSGHQAATSMWIWQALNITCDQTMRRATANRQTCQRLTRDYVTIWNKEIAQQPGVKEYVSKQTRALIRKFVRHLRESQNRLRKGHRAK